MRRQIKRALHQVLQALRIQRRQTRQPGAEFTERGDLRDREGLEPFEEGADRAGSGDRRTVALSWRFQCGASAGGWIVKPVTGRSVMSTSSRSRSRVAISPAGVARPRRCSRSCSIAAMSAGGAVAVIRAAALANSRSMACRSSASSKLDLAGRAIGRRWSVWPRARRCRWGGAHWPHRHRPPAPEGRRWARGSDRRRRTRRAVAWPGHWAV